MSNRAFKLDYFLFFRGIKLKIEALLALGIKERMKVTVKTRFGKTESGIVTELTDSYIVLDKKLLLILGAITSIERWH